MQKDIKNIVRDRYGAVAESALSADDQGVVAVAEAFGYSREELASVPADASMGLSCGNPIALASLRPGETVVDLGSGGGIDVFLASQRVGPGGRAIGIDMTPQMIERARRAAANGPGGKPYENVEFHLADMQNLPLPDASVDCIISNCVINLADDKNAVFREMFRVLRPGGRVAVSDIALRQALPADLAKDVSAYVGCVAGAIEISEYERGLRAAGFSAVQVIDTRADLGVYAEVGGGSACCAAPAKQPEPAAAGCCSAPAAGSAAASCCGGASAVHDDIDNTLDRYDVNEYAASVKVLAVKPK